MSSKVIRDAARAMVADASWAAAPPYFETTNEEPDPPSQSQPLWTTLDFEQFGDEQVEIGSPPVTYSETGDVRCIVLAQSGVGDTDAMDAAEIVKDLMLAWDAWPPGFNLTVSGPDQFQPGADGRWLETIVTATYRWSHVMG